jgi:hypothetical protein
MTARKNRKLRRISAQEGQTLNELDPPAWGPPTYDSGLVIRCHELREKPLSDFTVEDLRIMIGQQISLRHLVPRAISVLEEDPLAEGNYYAGDLLNAVLSIDAQYWRTNPGDRARISEIVDALASLDEDLVDSIHTFRSMNP